MKKTKKRNIKKRYKISCKKILSLLFKMAIMFFVVYAIYTRVQDVNGVSWFFTTWN